jgi:LysR family transcriptional regulator, putative pyruvate carboxylase regulator
MPYRLARLIQRLSFRQLQVFHTVYRKQSYSRAAEELNLTQPAVSSQIRLLEQALGQPVFDYVGKKLYVTAAGEQVMRHVTELFDNLNVLQMELAVLQGQVRGQLRIAAVSTAQYVVPYLLKGFLDRFPQVDVRLKVINRARALEQLTLNQDDLLIMGMVPDSNGINLLPFLDNLLVPVVRANDPLLKQPIDTQTFLDAGLLIREQGSGTRHALEQWCREQKFQLNPKMEMGSNDAIKHGVLAELGVAVLPKVSISSELQLGSLEILKLPGFPLRRSWSIVYPKGKHPTPVMQAFLNFVKTPQPQGVESTSSPSLTGTARSSL